MSLLAWQVLLFGPCGSEWISKERLPRKPVHCENASNTLRDSPLKNVVKIRSDRTRRRSSTLTRRRSASLDAVRGILGCERADGLLSSVSEGAKVACIAPPRHTGGSTALRGACLQ